MIHRQPKTMQQRLKNLRHTSTRTVGRLGVIGLLIWFGITVYGGSATNRQMLLPGVACVLILLLLTDMHPTGSVGFHRGQFVEDFGRVSLIQSIAVLNRVGMFPVVLTVYLLYLLIDQTHFLDLHLHPVFIVLDESFLMILTLVSGVGLIAYEGTEKAYQYKKRSLAQTYQMIGLSIVLSVLTGLILLEQVAELGRIGVVIANIAMLLVFLVGLMLMEDEE